jgi:hypothetical protein
MKVVETIEPKVDPKEEFLMTQFQDPNNTLHLATLESLVEKLTESVPDGSVGYLDFVKTFLLTYQSFCDAEELLIALQKRFDVINTQNYDWKTFNEHRKPVQLRVCNVLLQWVKKYPFDFLRQDGGADAIEILLHYIDTVLAEDHIALAKQLRKNLIKLVRKFDDSEIQRLIRKKKPFCRFRIQTTHLMISLPMKSFSNFRQKRLQISLR